MFGKMEYKSSRSSMGSWFSSRSMSRFISQLIELREGGHFLRKLSMKQPSTINTSKNLAGRFAHSPSISLSYAPNRFCKLSVTVCTIDSNISGLVFKRRNAFCFSSSIEAYCGFPWWYGPNDTNCGSNAFGWTSLMNVGIL